ncbi:tRNA (guanosine(46)-N7)-methyltransferase TrmB [Parasporobacterium paucivorans]|uniref:tRNA (guanine-N(7)-)-methyltransferase n=1 Tax=Parasporobacterium paucivorans DSM 15970 TaxID=1122934 RepID=A0A1M6B8B4_9FIRM|nr:tRNA (guanosine(46)-N7)-methyltransferase TrmB [Parasporobacterium paucivorans]SHI44930.1 tRNA (guanine-N(7)-)-methyltransferase [Parasporobacterium paucivorans DSM 15970]
MRLRNVRGSKEAIAESPYVINNPEEYRNKWREVFNNSNPLYIEIGMGKGRFLTRLAQQNPGINYVGIEKYASVLYRALEKREKMKMDNLYFIGMDAEDIAAVFGEGEVDWIYLNFSDPWPKDRHAKRRLTSKEFFGRYDRILRKDGRIEFKTDNMDLFDFSLEQIPLTNFEITAYTKDLHNDAMNEGNVMTEYEEKFSGLGHPICKLIAERKKA